MRRSPLSTSARPYRVGCKTRARPARKKQRNWARRSSARRSNPPVPRHGEHPMPRGDDDRLMERLGYAFRDPLLLDRALTHSSSVPELRTARGEDIAFSGSIVQDNERLEFLGDAVLELLTSEYLLQNFPDWTEGQLSKSRARIVNAHSLEDAARRLRLGEQ